MTDNELIQVFLPIITSGLITDGFSGVIVTQFNQPTQQGVSVPPTVYFQKIGDHRYGFLDRKDESVDGSIVHTETQFYETRFQINALVIQDPTNIALYTTSDLVNEVAAIMQSDSTLQILEINDIGILRVESLINPYFLDDSDNFEASPSFDFILTHKQIRTTATPMINSFEEQIYRI